MRKKRSLFFQKAVELDPDYSSAYAGLGRIYWDSSRLWWWLASGTTWQHTFELAQENLAKAMRKPTADAYALSAEMNVRMGKHDQALGDIERAIALGPSIADSTITKARILNAVGEAGPLENLVATSVFAGLAYDYRILRSHGAKQLPILSVVAEAVGRDEVEDRVSVR